MELILNVYGDCTSDKPTKTYTVRKLLFKTAKQLGALQEESKHAGDEDQEAITLKMLKTVIPNFKDEDFDGLDILEVGDLFRKLGSNISAIVAGAQKN